MLFKSQRPERFPIGSEIPPLNYQTDAGVKSLADARGRTLVLVYQSTCSFCKTEFDAWNRLIEAVKGTRLIVLTPEDSIHRALLQEKWPVFVNAANAEWGTMDAREYEAAFGSLLTPAHFLFEHGRLTRKIIGLTNVERLMTELNAQ